MAARALIGPTGYGGTYGIVWRDFPEMEARGGYSGPFESFEAAEENARAALAWWAPELGPLEVERVPNVNELDAGPGGGA